jgi:hypothetical protein
MLVIAPSRPYLLYWCVEDAGNDKIAFLRFDGQTTFSSSGLSDSIVGPTSCRSAAPPMTIAFADDAVGVSCNGGLGRH